MHYLIYFVNNGGLPQAADPMKIRVGKYEISICGDSLQRNPVEYRRTELVIFDDKDEIVHREVLVSVQSIVNAVKWCEDRIKEI